MSQNLTKILMSIFLIAACVSLLSKRGFGAPEGFKNASVEETHKAVTAGKIQFIDVREKNEVAVIAPQGARNIPMSVINKSSFEADTGIKKADALYIICRSGSRSARVARDLAGEGFSNIFNVSGGMIAWEKAKLPTVKNP